MEDEAATAVATYDYIIVGAGIAGLYTAIQLLRQPGGPKPRITVLEKYKHIGGRVDTAKVTKDGKSWSWEAGAGRISRSHTLLMGLLKRYGLHFMPIGETVQFKRDIASPLEPNIYESGMPAFLDPVAALPATDLARHTLRQLLEKVHGQKTTDEYLLHFPYRAEVGVMRADLALDTFRHEMGTQAGFGICAEGLSTLIDHMVEELESLGGGVQPHHEVVHVEQAGRRSPVQLKVRVGPPKDGVGRPVQRMEAPHVIFAVEADALREMPGLPAWSGLRHLRMEPLLRVYAVFPEIGKEVAAAFSSRIVTPDPVRFVIPGDLKKGVVQISYTDSEDARHWKPTLDEKGEEGLGMAVVERLRELVTPSLPTPLFSKAHYWKHGATYWLPGAYSPQEMSRQALHPFPDTLPGVHFCGESYSLRQAWMEGALEHADALVKRLRPRSRHSPRHH
jgi:monoamine oxidase